MEVRKMAPDNNENYKTLLQVFTGGGVLTAVIAYFRGNQTLHKRVSDLKSQVETENITIITCKEHRGVIHESMAKDIEHIKESIDILIKRK